MTFARADVVLVLTFALILLGVGVLCLALALLAVRRVLVVLAASHDSLVVWVGALARRVACPQCGALDCRLEGVEHGRNRPMVSRPAFRPGTKWRGRPE